MKKIFIVPNTSNFYDKKQAQELADGFRELGHQAFAFEHPITPHPYDFSTDFIKSHHISKKEIFKSLDADLIIEINRKRSKYIPKKIIHLSWYQDIRPSDYYLLSQPSETINKQDITYLLGSPQHFGFYEERHNIKCLLSGLSKSTINQEVNPEGQRAFDVSLVGYFPKIKTHMPLDIKKHRFSLILKELFRSPKGILKVFLLKNSDLNIEKFFYDKTYIQIENEIIKSYEALCGIMTGPNKLYLKDKITKHIYDILYIELPRKIDRLELYKAFSIMNSLSINVKIFGQNWLESFPWSPFIEKHTYQPFEVFKQSKISVHNNTHGLGIHSRVLEAMAAGSFLIMHPSPNSALPGGMDLYFAPNVHYGLYEKDKIIEQVKEWLADKCMRKKAEKENRKILLNKHLWRHRADQILGDLQ